VLVDALVESGLVEETFGSKRQKLSPTFDVSTCTAIERVVLPAHVGRPPPGATGARFAPPVPVALVVRCGYRWRVGHPGVVRARWTTPCAF
jgi:hypothetical protein